MRSIVFCSAVAVLLATATCALADPMPVKVSFTASGTANVAETYEGGGCTVATNDVFGLSWDAEYKSTVSDDGTLAGANGELEGSPGTFDFTSQSYGGPIGCSAVAGKAAPACSGALAADGTPQLSVLGAGAGDTGPQNLEAQSVMHLGTPSCPGSGQPDFIGRDISVVNASLPGSMTGMVTVPQGALDSGATYTADVNSGAAPSQIASNCATTGATATGIQSCTASMSWSGKLTISPDCGPMEPPAGSHFKVSFQEGQVSGINSDGTVDPGQTITTGANGRVELTAPDGSTFRIGPNSKVDAPPCLTTDDQGKPGISLKVLLGELWELVVDATGGNDYVQTDRAVGGVRGSSITYSVDKTGTVHGHVVEGLGWMRLSGTNQVTYYHAGQSFVLGKTGGPQLTFDWPKADRALVPPKVMKAASKLVCTVPKLKGLTLPAATKALKKGHCGVGKVKKPKGSAKQAKLVVASANVPANTITTKGTKVALKLKRKH